MRGREWIGSLNAAEPPGEFPVPLFDVVANCITIRGSFVGTRQDMDEALAFAVGGKVKADVELQHLSSINQIFDRLEHGDVPSRVVLEFAPANTENRRSEIDRHFAIAGAGPTGDQFGRDQKGPSPAKPSTML
jgi:hypothetical protein